MGEGDDERDEWDEGGVGGNTVVFTAVSSSGHIVCKSCRCRIVGTVMV